MHLYQHSRTQRGSERYLTAATGKLLSKSPYAAGTFYILF